MKLVLGSQSKWRASVLRAAGFTFAQAAADIDEKAVVVGDGSRLLKGVVVFFFCTHFPTAVLSCITHYHSTRFLRPVAAHACNRSGQGCHAGSSFCVGERPHSSHHERFVGWLVHIFMVVISYHIGLKLPFADQVIAYRNTIREKPETEAQCREYLASYESEPACTVTAVVVTNAQTGEQVSGVDIARQWFKPIPGDVVSRVIAKGDIMHCAGGFMVDDPDFHPYLAGREGDEDSIMGMPVALMRALLARLHYTP